MDIGSEVSEKIQLAIKAKLIEINAYVDDELPDYIMIMIANRKPEEQMADALSLFLASNAKSFTKWLYELLGTLRKKPTDKIENTNSTDNEPKVKSSSKEEIIAATPVDIPPSPKTDISKASRWDVKQVKRKSSSPPKENLEEIDNAAKDVTVSKEAVIDILPEKDDLFGDEFLDEVEEIPIKKTPKVLPVEKEKYIKKVVAPVVKHVSSTIKYTEKSSLKKNAPSKSPEKKQLRDIKVLKSSTQTSSTTELAKKSTSHQKRTVAVKSKESYRKVSTSEKEFSRQFAPVKSKKKKLKRSRERESPPSQKENIKTSHKRVREWDQDKGRQPLKYNDPEPSKRSNRPEKIERVSVKSRISSQVTSTVTIAQNTRYESEDSDEGTVHSSVISKVALPKRRSRLPPSKQANRSLLLKAVSEAESSIKKHILANKIIEPVSEEVFKSRVEKHKRAAVGNVVVKNKSRNVESSRSTVSSRLLRDTNLLQSTATDNAKQPEDVRIKLIRKRKPIADDVEKMPKRHKESELEVQDESPQVFGDSRRIISRDQAGPERRKTQVTRVSSDVEKAFKTRFDTRKLSVKASSKQMKAVQDENEAVEQRVIQRKRSDEKESNETMPSPKRSKKKRSPSPCFIVTLDGSSTSNNSKDDDVPASKKKFPSTSLKKPENKKTTTSDKTTKTEKTKMTSKLTGQVVTSKPTGQVVTSKPTGQVVTSKLTGQVMTSKPTGQVVTSKPTGQVVTSKPADQVAKKVTTEKRKSAGDEANLSDRELANMREKLLAMQEQAKKLKEIQSKQQEILQQKLNNGQSIAKPNNKLIHIANVHFSATENQLSDHFSICGAVSKVNILKDSFSGHAKGFAHVEFEEEKSVAVALALDGTTFCGRNIDISKKPNELASAATPPSKRFYTQKRFNHPGTYSRYNARIPSASTTWSRAPVTRNKTWVKPGHTPS